MRQSNEVYNLYSNRDIERSWLPEKNQPVSIYQYKNTDSIKNDLFSHLIILDYGIFKRDIKYFMAKGNIYNSCLIVITNESNIDDTETISIDAVNFIIYEKCNSIVNKKIIESAVKYLAKFSAEHAKQDEMSSIAYELNTLHKIGIALSSEKDINKLLMMILSKAKELTNSDAGSLWIVENKEEGVFLKLTYSENDTSKSDYTTFSIPLDRKSISGYVADTGKYVMIDNAYDISEDAEYRFNKSFDDVTGYHTISMLTVPLINNKSEVLGAIQLLNRKTCQDAIPNGNFENYVIPYDNNMIELSQAFASQASVALENAMLYKTLEESFENLVRASISAIESRDPTTSGHTNRIGVYTLAIANAVNETKEGVYKDVYFDDEKMKELRYASLLHDIGKIGVKESVLMKPKKLYTEQIEKIKRRIAEAKASYVRNIMDKNASLQDKENKQESINDYFNKLNKYMDVIFNVNEPNIFSEQMKETLVPIIEYVYESENGNIKKILDESDIEALSIQRGSLTPKERMEIESHIVHTRKFLEKINWPRDLSNVIDIASKHHEYLNGSGYPDGCIDEKISIQTRMMTIADIYDSLTASDRPYKKSLSSEKTIAILQEEADKGRLDKELVRIFAKMMSF